jgi:large subunit ribosomal protein L10
MAKQTKIDAVERIRAKLTSAKGTYLADFQGMDVAQATELRNRCREAGVEFEVVKNTLTLRAVEDETLRAALEPHLAGPTALATSAEDEIAAAKVISEFIKEFEKPAFKAGVIDGKVMDAGQVAVLAKLPGKDVLLGKLVGGLKQPVQMLHGALSAPLRDLAQVLKQVSEKKA